MGISCGAKVIKIVLFVFNLIWLALACVIFYLGIKVLTKFSTEVNEVIKQTPSHAAIVLLASGGVMIFIAFLGCCGAIKESFWMLNTYGVLIFLCLAAESVGAYLALRYQYDLQTYAEEAIRSGMQAYRWQGSSTDPANKAINEFQKHLQCCGANGTTDWDSINIPDRPDEDKDNSYPPSCCTIEADATNKGKCPRGKTWKKGCVESIIDLLTGTLGGLGYVAIALVLIQLLIIISACCLAKEVHGKYKTYSAPRK